MAATKRRRFEPAPGLFWCSVCSRALQPEAFLAIVVKDKRCKPGHALETRSYDCRECRNERKRELRRKKAEADGRNFMTRSELEAQWRTARQERKVQRRVAWAICLAFWKLIKLSKEERCRRAVRRQKERYHTDPSYYAQVQAKKIRRKRAMKGSQVDPVRHHIVAERDGWRCGICGGKVTRATWSLDHVIPLSKGGPHTYANVVLAHRACNVKRGVDRLPVQASLFVMPASHPTPGAKVTPERVPAVRVAEPRGGTSSSVADV